VSARFAATILDGVAGLSMRRLTLLLAEWFEHPPALADHDPYRDFAAAQVAFAEASGSAAKEVRVAYDPEADDAQFLFRVEAGSKSTWWLARRQGAVT
jgi:hypothetical protein